MEKNDNIENNETDVKKTLEKSSNSPICMNRSAFLSGSYSHSVDAKGRVIIPQPLREQIGNDIVIGVTDTNDNIAVYTRAMWETKFERLHELSSYEPRLEDLLDYFLMFSYTNEAFDNQGRILIPALLREKFNIDSEELVISGSFDHIKIRKKTVVNEEFKRPVFEKNEIKELISITNAKIREEKRNEKKELE